MGKKSISDTFAVFRTSLETEDCKKEKAERDPLVWAQQQGLDTMAPCLVLLEICPMTNNLLTSLCKPRRWQSPEIRVFLFPCSWVGSRTCTRRAAISRPAWWVDEHSGWQDSGIYWSFWLPLNDEYTLCFAELRSMHQLWMGKTISFKEAVMVNLCYFISAKDC